MSRTLSAASARPWLVATRITVAVVVVLMLACCGKKGNPSPPAGEPNTFPRSYPAQ